MEFPEKNLLVLASAGSGKTFRLSDRIIGLMAREVEPERIVALTFTRKAAGEFADAILRKLAEAAKDPGKAAELEARLGMAAVDFIGLLEKVTGKLPRLTLGTMDSFFSKVVKGFQYELGVTGGRFELLQGEVAEVMKDELLEGLLESGAHGHDEEEFVEIFRRATQGKEGAAVLEDLRGFIAGWHGIFVSPKNPAWGPPELAGVEVSEWDRQKGALVDVLERDWPNVAKTHKDQEKKAGDMFALLRNHTIGSGSLNVTSGIWPKVLEGILAGSGPIHAKVSKDFTITGLAAESLRNLAELAARCELAAALSRTQGVRGLIASYDGLVERELRRKGKLGFDDVKRLMGSWMSGEETRLRREAVDFRLDANYGHWLLDEFQDTSRDEWNALLPLVDEAFTGDESTVFVVGDKKQAIYAWRGGEVGLFDELTETYGGGLEIATMAESWRSCPEVLEPVNRVFGDKATMEGLFGNAATRWEWERHVPAKPLRKPENAGHALIEVMDKEGKAERVIGLLKRLGVGRKRISCGILMSTNDKVKALADELRAAGFQVVEEGEREPGKDHPVGVMVWQLLRWLADPADRFAERTVMMSPLKGVLETRFGGAWQAAWEGLGGRVSEVGFAGMVGELVAPLLDGWEKFGRRRAEDMLEALGDLDRQGVVTAREAADGIGRRKISQSPGVAAVQVMTVHKSKGLGFDVVILPDVPSKKIPDLTHYRTVIGDGWITMAPAQWVREMIPELKEAEENWAEQQAYESFCKLYVAMTRAKRGLYVFLDTPAASTDDGKASLSNWLMTSLDLDGAENTVFETGNPAWADGVEEIEASPAAAIAALGKPVAKRSRRTPSGEKSKQGTTGSADGRRFGTAIHAAFEKVAWLDEGEAPVFPPELRKILGEVLAVPEIRNLLSRKQESISLFREQRIEAVLDGDWLSGAIDRLHVRRDANGSATRVEIIDFKTDRVNSAEELVTRYTGQMDAYRRAMQAIHPRAEVRCLLISTALMSVVEG
jgi:ATP-dependent exoDNAse (exonuclease V) beta subunit